MYGSNKAKMGFIYKNIENRNRNKNMKEISIFNWLNLENAWEYSTYGEFHNKMYSFIHESDVDDNVDDDLNK
jgi:hypothetical protein